jgi:hypothetical protein
MSNANIQHQDCPVLAGKFPAMLSFGNANYEFHNYGFVRSARKILFCTSLYIK